MMISVERMRSVLTLKGPTNVFVTDARRGERLEVAQYMSTTSILRLYCGQMLSYIARKRS